MLVFTGMADKRLRIASHILRFISGAGVLLCLFFGGRALANQDDGELDTTGPVYSSQGNSDMKLHLPEIVLLTGLSDLNFGSYDFTGDVSLDWPVCVYVNYGGSKEYYVEATGSWDDHGDSGSDFYIKWADVHGKYGVIPYSVKWNDEATAGGIALTAGVQTTQAQGPASNSQDCGGVKNGNYQVTIKKNDIMKVPAGTYAGVLTIVIIPSVAS
jgi:hypothetical protein